MPCRHFVVTTVSLVLFFSNTCIIVMGLRELFLITRNRENKLLCLLQRQDTENIFEARNIDEICSQNRKADWDNFCTFRNDIISKVRKRKFDYFDELTEKISKQERFGNKHWKKLVTSILRRRREKRY